MSPAEPAPSLSNGDGRTSDLSKLVGALWRDLTFQPRSLVLDGCPMFAQAYMGRKRILPMLSLHTQGISFLAAVFSPHSKSVGRAAPRLFRPMYAWANMGHPSRDGGFVRLF